MNNPKAPKKINLKGIAVGDGLFEVETQVKGFGQLAFYLGIADENEMKVINGYENAVITAVQHKDYIAAFNIFDEMLNGDFWPYPTYFFNITGNANYFNIRDVNYPSNPYSVYVKTPEIRKRLHVGNVAYSDYNATVERHLMEDFAISVKPFLETLLNNDYKVLIYNGQNDLIISGPLCEVFLQTLKWKGQDKYLSAKKKVWRIHPRDNYVAGFIRQSDNFYQAIIRDAGHMVPTDQPDRMYDLITRFIEGRPFN